MCRDDEPIICRRLIFITLLVFLLTACSLSPEGEETPAPPIITDGPPPAATTNLRRLLEAPLPERDLVALAAELGGVEDAPRTAPLDEMPSPGDVRQFWYKNHDSDENVQIWATLLYQSRELNLWVQEGLEVDEGTLAEAATVLESQILPTNRAFFGQEWRPGIDGDPRLNILHLENIGQNVVGYFSLADEFVTTINPYSNQREMIYVSMAFAPPSSEEYYQVIAHELQHMIHWHTDANEATWLDEGLSVLAARLNGYDGGGFDRAFAARPDVQLNEFDYESADTGAHYGASFLFASYFLDRFGEDATRTLVRHPQNGTMGIEAVLSEMGQPQPFHRLFADWAAATFLDGAGRGQGVYNYSDTDVPQIQPDAVITDFPLHGKAAVNQYGSDYIEVENTAPVTVVFTGTRQIQLLQTTPHSGQYFWTTAPADNSHMTLTRPFNLTELSQATLSFWSWYEIEEGWDYAYVTVSGDGGRTWQIVETEQTTLEDPQGNSYGPGLTGVSGPGNVPRWVRQTADLSAYAGGPLLVSFRYVTDQAVHRQGLALDDIGIVELDEEDDVESGTNGWEARGFARHSNVLPQAFIAQRILIGPQTVDVQHLPLDEKQQGRWTLPLDRDVRRAILVISGATPVTSLPASYAYEMSEAPSGTNE